MYKGMYVAMTGAVLRSQEMDVIANNLANLNTSGYKKTSFSSYMYPIAKDAAPQKAPLYPTARDMTYFGEYKIDTSAGSIKSTGNPFDVAINGDGFLSVEKNGKTYYTRNGALGRDKEGFLINAQGLKVMDIKGSPVKIEGNNIGFAGNGDIYADGKVIGTMKIANLKNVQNIGDSLYSGNETGTASGTVTQGSIEMSNSNAISEMVGMVTAVREYETAMKFIQNFNDLSQRTVTDIGKLA